MAHALTGAAPGRAVACRLQRRLAAVALLLGVVGCTGLPNGGGRHDDGWREVRVLDRGQDAGGSFCADFALDPGQALWLLQRSRLLDARELHDRFDLLPCWVRGQVSRQDGLWQWEARAGGTLRLVGPAGQVQWRACEGCEAVLSGPAR